MSILKRPRDNNDRAMCPPCSVGQVRACDVDCSVVTPVFEELRRMCISGLSIQKTGYALRLSVADVVLWITKGHTHTPDEMEEFFGHTLMLTGLEDSDLELSRDDLQLMAQTVCGLMRGCIFSGDVDLSINRAEARLLGSRKKLGSILAFVRGDCNMKLGKVVTCGDGNKVDEISFSLLPQDEKDFFLSIQLEFFCFYNLCADTENTVIKANWDGFGCPPP